MDWSEFGSDFSKSAGFLLSVGGVCYGLHSLHDSILGSPTSCTRSNSRPRPLEGKVPRSIETLTYALGTTVAFVFAVRALRNL